MSQVFLEYLKKQSGLTDSELEQLQNCVPEKSVRKGEFLLRSGEVCRHTYFVEEGLLRFYSIDESGKDHIVQFAPENNFISDRGSLYFGAVSDYFIDAIEDARVVLIDDAFVQKITDISPGFRMYNQRLMHNHVRHLQNRINMLLGASAEARYMEFIKQYPDLTFRVPQWMIASYLGITPESLSRVRKELARRNFKPANGTTK